jgi:RNase P/RNase MRP subunit p30
MRSQSELEAFARIIGVSDAKASLNALHRKILANRKRQLPGYIADGAEQLDC